MNKTVLLGANTARGFVSFYDQILVPKAKFLGIIKGGPGTGKSTFMRKIGEKISQAGFQIEELRCSSDQASLDGIVVRGQGIALVDGTRPHIMEPYYPGCRDEIINFGEFWDRDAICARQTEIEALSQAISERYARIYRLLAAANELSLAWSEAARLVDSGGVNRIADELLASFSHMPVAASGKERHLFASSLSPNGYVHYLESILEPLAEVYVLKDTYCRSAHTVLERLLAAAKTRGLFVEVYHCPLEPKRIEQLVIEELSLGFAATCPHHTYIPEGAKLVDLDQFVEPGEDISFLDQLKETEKRIISWAAQELGAIKSLHDELESYYYPHMDFTGTEKLLARTLERIFRLLPTQVPAR